MSKIKESTQYDNFIDKKEEIPENDLSSFLGIEKKEENFREKLWVGMPEYVQENNPPYRTIYLHFRNKEDFDEFVSKYKTIDDEQVISKKTKSMWYPKLDKDENRLKRWFEE